MSHVPPYVVHIASGDRWAGAEVQVCTLLTQLHQTGQVRVAAILMNDGELAKRLRAAGVSVEVLDESRLGFLALLKGTARILRTRRPDLVHTHRQKENLVGVLASLPLGIPSVRTVHGAPENAPSGLVRHILAWTDDWTAVHCQRRVIAVSRDLGFQLRKRLPRAYIATIPNGIDVEAVRAAAEPKADLGPRIPGESQIGIVGRLDPVKRVDIFLDMAAELLDRDPSAWRFHVFGEGQLRHTLESRAERLGIAERVLFHGQRMDIAACIAALDVLVMCSDHEGLPMTPLEALAVGTPVVAHAVGGLVEALQDQPRSILVEDHQSTSYASAVARLAKCEDGKARISRTNDAWHDSPFTASSNASAVAALYKNVQQGAMDEK